MADALWSACILLVTSCHREEQPQAKQAADKEGGWGRLLPPGVKQPKKR